MLPNSVDVSKGLECGLAKECEDAVLAWRKYVGTPDVLFGGSKTTNEASEPNIWPSIDQLPTPTPKSQKGSGMSI